MNRLKRFVRHPRYRQARAALSWCVWIAMLFAAIAAVD